MSGLARLLAGHTAAGVYRWASSAPTSVVQHAVEHAGWRFVGLDTWAVDEKAGFLDVCEQAFGFPAWVGRNFDALADALSDVRGPDGTGVLVLWEGWSPLARGQRRDFEVVLSVFLERVGFERAGPFGVLLREPGPDDVGLPELDPHQHS